MATDRHEAKLTNAGQYVRVNTIAPVALHAADHGAFPSVLHSGGQSGKSIRGVCCATLNVGQLVFFFAAAVNDGLRPLCIDLFKSCSADPVGYGGCTLPQPKLVISISKLNATLGWFFAFRKFRRKHCGSKQSEAGGVATAQRRVVV